MSFTSICHILYFTVKYVIYIHSSIQICEVSWCYSRPTPVLECAYCSNFCKGCKKHKRLSRISYKILPHVMVTLYYSLIYPYLTYCNMIWSSTYTSRLSHLVILQKKAIRIINKSPYNFHTAPLFHMHGFLNIEQIKKFQISEFMFKFNRGLLPKVFSTYFVMVSDIHTHLTRSA